MHGIGSVERAAEIYEWVSSSRVRYSLPRRVLSERAPEGWRFVGQGSFRSVWLSPEGVAYKIEHNADYTAQGEREIENLEAAWSEGAPPEGCRLPKFHSYRIDNELVIAVEMISGKTLYEYEGPQRAYLYECLEECGTKYRLRDLHDENAVVDEDGILVPVDWGI